MNSEFNEKVEPRPNGSLIIADDGVGAAFAPAGTGIGRTLMSGFAKQLDGQLSIAGPPGTTIAVKFTPRSTERQSSPLST